MYSVCFDYQISLVIQIRLCRACKLWLSSFTCHDERLQIDSREYHCSITNITTIFLIQRNNCNKRQVCTIQLRLLQQSSFQDHFRRVVTLAKCIFVFATFDFQTIHTSYRSQIRDIHDFILSYINSALYPQFLTVM